MLQWMQVIASRLYAPNELQIAGQNTKFLQSERILHAACAVSESYVVGRGMAWLCIPVNH
eukprot:scaffold248509_cov17-Tisochrysis_lutea.AAC.2